MASFYEIFSPCTQFIVKQLRSCPLWGSINMLPAVSAIMAPGIGRDDGTTFLEHAQIPHHTPRAVIQLGLSQVITAVITMCFHHTQSGEPRVGSSAADMWLLPIQSASQSCFLSVRTMFCFAVICIGSERNSPLLRLGPYHLFLKDGSDSMHLRECYNG